VSFAKEGYVFIAIAIVIAAAAYAAAIARRSFGLWLAAFLLTLLAIWVAYVFRDRERTGERGDRVVVSPADG
jgi:phosphatidylserine decarboxylase